MTFAVDERLVRVLGRLRRRDPVLYDAVQRKMREVASHDPSHYKNLRAPLHEFRRMHVGPFVLLFCYSPGDNHVEFMRLCHHDKAYR